MKKIIILLMLTFCVSISFAQYTPMTAAGYQFKRILCDSTLHIPSFCGIPTLRNSTAKNGAIAMDTCNFKIYMWTNAAGWGEIIGAGTDTTSLSNRIDQRVKYTDTAQMLLAYLRKQDTANKWVANVTKVNDSTIRVFKGNTITDLKILGKQIDTTSLSNRIDQKLGKADSSIYYTKYRSDTSRTNIYNAINNKLSKSDSTIYYTKYRSDTSRTNIYNAINQKLNITDTTNKWVNNVTKVNDSTIRVWKGTTSTTIELPRGSGGGGGTGTVYNVSTGYALSGGPINTTGTIIVDSAVLSTKYLRRADTSNLVATKSNLALKLNISDSALMLSKYLRKVDTFSLSNRINLKLNISDTTNKWVANVTKKNDSTITVYKGTTATDITLPRGAGGGGSGTVTNVATGYGLSGGPITSTGTVIVDSATLSTKYLRRADTSNLVATKSNVALKLNISDTTNKFVNSVTKINDTAIRVWKGTTSSVISFAKDVVYTQSPIMSKISNDSNIIYFNADTANAWRGGGSGTTPSLQDVLTVGNTASNKNIVLQESTNAYSLNLSSSDSWYPFLSITDPVTNDGYTELVGGQLYVQSIGLNKSLQMNPTGGYMFYDINTAKYASIVDSGRIDNQKIAIPKSSGTIALSVNNIFADSTGNITITTGGGGSTGRFGNDTATVVMAKVHNNSGVTLTNGKIVALSSSGTSSNEPAVRLANNKHDSTSANTLGFVSGSIAVNDTGWVILSGKIEKLNTSAFANGDIIYLDSISGEWTKSKPVAPYHLVYLGVVTKANAGNGSIFVKPQNGYELNEIHDAKITSPLNNQVLAYSDTQSLWKNRNIYSIVDTVNTITTKYRTDTSRTNIYNAINGKQAAGTYVTSVSGTSPISSSGGTTPAISISQATTSTNGYLSSTDWNTFNNKQSVDTTTYYLISDFNTTSTTGANSNLTFNLGANEVRRIMIAGTCSKATSSTGLKVGIAAPTGATIKASVYGQLNTINATSNSILTAINTLSGTMNTAIATEMPFRIEGVITNGSTAGAVTLQLATVTSNTATIYAGTVMSVTKVKGL